MKGTLKARATWEALDRPGRDTCKLWQGDEGWMLVGRAAFRYNGTDAVLDYVVRCNRDWISQSADVSGTLGGDAVGWHLDRDGEGWRLNGVAVAGSAFCRDVDLGFTPATNLLPIRRLDLRIDAPQEVAAIWLRVPEGRAQVLPQTYERLSHRAIRYASPGYGVDLDVHPTGFVTEYPEGWRGQVDVG